MNHKIKALLNEKGIYRRSDGWRQEIRSYGPPGLTNWEQETNRIGGRYLGRNAMEAITQVILDWLDRAVSAINTNKSRSENGK